MKYPPTVDVNLLPPDVLTRLHFGKEERAGLIAHAIHLGQQPPVGKILGFSLQLQEAELTNFDAIKHGDFSTVIDKTDKIWLHIIVTQEDIDNAIQLIAAQKIEYNEPKTSILKKDEPPLNAHLS